jgi:hypothetical protein
MSGTTAELGLATATDTDDIEVYNVTQLAAALVLLDALFSASAGHDHTGVHKGKPIPSSGLAQPLALTSPVLTTPTLTTPTISTGGLTITSGSLTLTSGSLTLTSGNLSVTGLAGGFALTINANAGAGTNQGVLIAAGSTIAEAALQVMNRAGSLNILYCYGNGDIGIGAAGHQLGFLGTPPVGKPTVTGAKAGNAALASLLAALSGMGLLADSSS